MPSNVSQITKEQPAVLDFLGPTLDPDEARKLCRGLLDPRSMKSSGLEATSSTTCLNWFDASKSNGAHPAVKSLQNITVKDKKGFNKAKQNMDAMKRSRFSANLLSTSTWIKKRKVFKCETSSGQEEENNGEMECHVAISPAASSPLDENKAPFSENTDARSMSKSRLDAIDFNVVKMTASTHNKNVTSSKPIRDGFMAMLNKYKLSQQD